MGTEGCVKLLADLGSTTEFNNLARQWFCNFGCGHHRVTTGAGSAIHTRGHWLPGRKR
jgi:hypothetical protein